MFPEPGLPVRSSPFSDRLVLFFVLFYFRLDIFTLSFYCFLLRSRSLEIWFPGRDAATRFTGTLVSTKPIRLLEHPPQLPGAPTTSGTQNPISFDPNRFSPGHPYPTRACSRVQIPARCCVWENLTTHTRKIDRAKVRWGVVFQDNRENQN